MTEYQVNKSASINQEIRSPSMPKISRFLSVIILAASSFGTESKADPVKFIPVEQGSHTLGVGYCSGEIIKRSGKTLLVTVLHCLSDEQIDLLTQQGAITYLTTKTKYTDTTFNPKPTSRNDAAISIDVAKASKGIKLILENLQTKATITPASDITNALNDSNQNGIVDQDEKTSPTKIFFPKELTKDYKVLGYQSQSGVDGQQKFHTLGDALDASGEGYSGMVIHQIVQLSNGSNAKRMMYLIASGVSPSEFSVRVVDGKGKESILKFPGVHNYRVQVFNLETGGITVFQKHLTPDLVKKVMIDKRHFVELKHCPNIDDVDNCF